MGFVRVHEQEAARANAILYSDISKLNTVIGSQGKISNNISDTGDMLSSLIGTSLTDKEAKINSLIGQISALKGEISSKAKELDDIEYQKWIAEQRRLEEARRKKMEEEK